MYGKKSDSKSGFGPRSTYVYQGWQKRKGEAHINVYHLEAAASGVAKGQLNASVSKIHFKCIYIKITLTFISIRRKA